MLHVVGKFSESNTGLPQIQNLKSRKWREGRTHVGACEEEQKMFRFKRISVDKRSVSGDNIF